MSYFLTELFPVRMHLLLQVLQVINIQHGCIYQGKQLCDHKGLDLFILVLKIYQYSVRHPTLQKLISGRWHHHLLSLGIITSSSYFSLHLLFFALTLSLSLHLSQKHMICSRFQGLRALLSNMRETTRAPGRAWLSEQYKGSF